MDQNNYYNSNLEMVRNRNKGKQIEEERKNYDHLFSIDQDYQKHKTEMLECQVYLYEEADINSPAAPRIALVFHFKHHFDIAIEGVGVDGHITHTERLGLPHGLGKYFNLTPTFIKCIPMNVINYGSKGNKLNGSAMLNPRDWAFQALTALSLDSLVHNINQHKVTPSCPPQMEPKETWSDSVRNFATGMMSGCLSNEGAAANNGKSKKKMPVEIPQMTVPHVPSEYDNQIRNAVVIKFNNGNHCGIMFHFEGDDAFRTVQGVWDDNTIKPSFKKERPVGNEGVFMELGTVQTSPGKVRDITLGNAYNGAKLDSGVTEMDWAKVICDKVGLHDKWDRGTIWKYVHPPQYTVAPDRTVFTLPSSKSSSSRI